MSVTSNAQQSLSDSVKAPIRTCIQLGDAAITSFVPASDSAVEQNRVVQYNFTTTSAGRSLTLVDADIDAAFGSPSVGAYKTFTIINRGANTVTLVAGGSPNVATGQGTLTVLTGTSARFNLQKLSATAPKWVVDRLYTTTFA